MEKPEELMQKEEEETKKECEARLVALNNELTKRFDENHFFRYYPELPCKEVPEYVCSNIPYASALAYIREYARQNSGHVVQSYMESLDAVFNDNHIYFGTSFYSEYGEYLISYAYTRLLSGARMIFIISDMEKAESLRRYIRDRLTSMTNCSNNATWRVYIKGERLDQADILIATPEDFRDDSIINHYPAFFEEVCNAVFVDADRITAIYGYLCPILSMRLKKATENRIRFIFLTRDIMRGFAAKSLPRYFCIDKVYTCSSALENESTAYTLLNRESKHHRIYNKHGQTLTSLECIVAEQAVKFGVDGVKVISGAPIDHADAVSLATKGVELNEFYKPVPKINYMIYADDRCNLASAIYTCTRFRGHVKSIANIISKPYLLRDYFVFMASNGEYINRSSFIQPRAVESMDIGKLSLLRIFCEASMDDGMSLAKFCEKMRNIIEMVGNRFSSAPSCFCGDMIEKIKSGELVPDEDDYAAYLVSGLFDYTGTGKDRSEGKKAKDYYLIVDSKYSTSASRDKTICFKRSKYFFDRLTDKNKRVELRLNDSTIGYLDTFPSRVHQQYMVGQSIIFRNMEYEIGEISDDSSVIYLRNENVTFKNSLDTFFLRRYDVRNLEKVGDEGILYRSNSNLAEIRVSHAIADITGENYGFFTLTCDNQTLDFSHGVEGNPWVGEARVSETARKLKGADCLVVTLRARVECNDEMRILISVVFNEFIKTIFPDTYRLLSICPVLASPIENAWDGDKSTDEQIRVLYPYLANSCLKETDDHIMRFIMVNDCADDVGIFDWFYDRGDISREGVTDAELQSIFAYVIGDWPELFWLSGYSYNTQTFKLTFRCLDENGDVDVRQIKKKIKLLKKGAKEFTKGITRRTKPYDACLKIYRRLILKLDYDGIGLNIRAGEDIGSDDSLRSLYSALVEHKVVCAGYAFAMQYLLQFVGISAAYVSSETAPGNTTHAFNTLRIGKYCYYIDATWGDNSNTMTGETNRGRITYDYFCVPYREFVMTGGNAREYHEPRKEYYTNLEEFKATRHEYFRHNDAYFDRYDEDKLMKLIVRTANEYDEKEMGDFCIAFRAANEQVRDYIVDMLWNKGKLSDIIGRAKEVIKKKKKKALLEGNLIMSAQKGLPTAYFWIMPEKNGRK